MLFLSGVLLATAATTASAAATASSSASALAVSKALSLDISFFGKREVIARDVVVIGGGATGTYASINLKDQGQSVLVIEKEDRMGGHTNSYFDSESGRHVDYGVQTYWNIPVVRDFFERFGITTEPFSLIDEDPKFYDFTTGKEVQNFTFTPSLQKYAGELFKFPELSYSWDIQYPVNEELLMPFRDFIKKYNIEDEVWLLHTTLFGVGNPSSILDQPTVNIFKYTDKSFIDAALGGDVSAKRPEHYNGEIYDKAQKELLSNGDLLLSSTVTKANRNCMGRGVCLAVQTPEGPKMVLAKKLLITAPPTVKNISPFNITPEENNLFKKWTYSNYYVGVFKHTGLKSSATYYNANPDTPFNLPRLSDTYLIQHTDVENVFYYWFGGPTAMTQKQVESQISAEVCKMTPCGAKPTFLQFGDHSPFKLIVGADDIAGGFYKNLKALQGKKNTFYTGAAWMSHGTGPLWNFTHYMLPDIVASL